MEENGKLIIASKIDTNGKTCQECFEPVSVFFSDQSKKKLKCGNNSFGFILQKETPRVNGVRP